MESRATAAQETLLRTILTSQYIGLVPVHTHFMSFNVYWWCRYLFARSFIIINRVGSPGQPVLCVHPTGALPHRPPRIKVALCTTEALGGPIVPQAFIVCWACVVGRQACTSQLQKAIFNVSNLGSLNPLVDRSRAHFYVDRHARGRQSHIYLPSRNDYFYPSYIR